MYYRKKSGKGFTYKDKKGNTVTDKKLKEWFNSLVIPPAWTEVEISEKKNANLLATGRDDKGRKQYIYNPKFRAQKESEKFERILEFADKLEHMRRVTGQHLRRKTLNRDKVMAVMVRLLESAYFRPGSDSYSKANKSYGITTMRSKHLRIEGDEMIFSYRGKSGKDQEKHVKEKRLAKIVQELDDMPGYEIFKYPDENGNLIDVKSEDLNAYIREHMGEKFSAKDFRTWSGTMIAASALDEMGAIEEEDQKKLDKNIREAVIKVAEKLGNTPAVARSSYIDPRIIDDYIDGKTIKYFENEIDLLLKNYKSLDRSELGVLCMLKNRFEKE